MEYTVGGGKELVGRETCRHPETQATAGQHEDPMQLMTRNVGRPEAGEYMFTPSPRDSRSLPMATGV